MIKYYFSALCLFLNLTAFAQIAVPFHAEAYDKKLELIINSPFLIPEFPVGLIYQDTTAGEGFMNLSHSHLVISDYPVGFQFMPNNPTFSELTTTGFKFYDQFDESGSWGKRFMGSNYDFSTNGDISNYEKISLVPRTLTNITSDPGEAKIIMQNYNSATTGSISFSGGVLGISTVSDRTLKENIEIEQNILPRILQLQLKSYNYLGSNTRSTGFIAQEVEALFPELISEIDGKKAVNYLGFSSLAIQAINEQQETISNLEQRIKALEKKIK